MAQNPSYYRQRQQGFVLQQPAVPQSQQPFAPPRQPYDPRLYQQQQQQQQLQQQQPPQNIYQQLQQQQPNHVYQQPQPLSSYSQQSATYQQPQSYPQPYQQPYPPQSYPHQQPYPYPQQPQPQPQPRQYVQQQPVPPSHQSYPPQTHPHPHRVSSIQSPPHHVSPQGAYQHPPASYTQPQHQTQPPYTQPQHPESSLAHNPNPHSVPAPHPARSNAAITNAITTTPPISASAIQARRPLPLPAPKRSESLPPSNSRPAALHRASTAGSGTFPSSSTSALPSFPSSSSSPDSSPSPTSSRRPLPTPTTHPNVNPPSRSTKHYSLDLTRFPTSSASGSPSPVKVGNDTRSGSLSPTKRAPSPVKRTTSPPRSPSPVKRRASPPKFNSTSSSPEKPPAALPPSNRSEQILPPDAAGGKGTGTGTKFVPLWKRALPTSPTQTPDLSQLGMGLGVLGGGIRNAEINANNTNTSNAGRPLPASPATGRAPGLGSGFHVRAPALAVDSGSGSSSEGEESESGNEDEDGEDEVYVGREPPSPQYGIRDLPRSGAGREVGSGGGAREGVPLPQPPVVGAGRTRGDGRAGLPQPPGVSRVGGSGSGGGESQGQGGGGGHSMTLRFAALGLEGDSSAGGGGSKMANASGSRVDGSGSGDLPRLPRMPGSSSSAGGRERERELVNLDDAPPPSLRRSPVPPVAGNGRQWQQRELPQPQVKGQEAQRHQGQTAQPPQQRHQSYSAPQPVQQQQPPQTYHPQPQPHWKSSSSSSSGVPGITIESPAPVGGRDRRADIPKISFPGDDDGEDSDEDEDGDDWRGGPSISVQGVDGGPRISIEEVGPDVRVEVPSVNVEGPSVNVEGPSVSVSMSGVGLLSSSGGARRQLRPVHRGGGLICGGCGGTIVGRIVNAMGVRWHPGCFRCTACDELLEHVSSYEHEGRPYCHLDYHENFAPRCYTCKTAIIEERFISLDDPALGKRTYHEQHFFCAECGDPFLAPSSTTATSTRTGELNVSGDGVFEDDDVGFTVYKGHPYCEACHVRLRLPKCKRCKRSIRDGMEAVEALGGKWCWECFVCAGCEKPFEDPSFFQRDNQPYCEPCFSLILRNDV